MSQPMTANQAIAEAVTRITEVLNAIEHSLPVPDAAGTVDAAMHAAMDPLVGARLDLVKITGMQHIPKVAPLAVDPHAPWLSYLTHLVYVADLVARVGSAIPAILEHGGPFEKVRDAAFSFAGVRHDEPGPSLTQRRGNQLAMLHGLDDQRLPADLGSIANLHKGLDTMRARARMLIAADAQLGKLGSIAIQPPAQAIVEAASSVMHDTRQIMLDAEMTPPTTWQIERPKTVPQARGLFARATSASPADENTLVTGAMRSVFQQHSGNYFVHMGVWPDHDAVLGKASAELQQLLPMYAYERGLPLAGGTALPATATATTTTTGVAVVNGVA